VYDGLLREMRAWCAENGEALSEDMVATVVAHETGHLLQRTEEVDPSASSGEKEESDDRQRRRNFEYDADRVALSLVARAGYNPREGMKAIRFLARFGERTALFGTHPRASDRIAQLEAIVESPDTVVAGLDVRPATVPSDVDDALKAEPEYPGTRLYTAAGREDIADAMATARTFGDAVEVFAVAQSYDRLASVENAADAEPLLRWQARRVFLHNVNAVLDAMRAAVQKRETVFDDDDGPPSETDDRLVGVATRYHETLGLRPSASAVDGGFADVAEEDARLACLRTTRRIELLAAESNSDKAACQRFKRMGEALSRAFENVSESNLLSFVRASELPSDGKRAGRWWVKDKNRAWVSRKDPDALLAWCASDGTPFFYDQLPSDARKAVHGSARIVAKSKGKARIPVPVPPEHSLGGAEGRTAFLARWRRSRLENMYAEESRARARRLSGEADEETPRRSKPVPVTELGHVAAVETAFRRRLRDRLTAACGDALWEDTADAIAAWMAASVEDDRHDESGKGLKAILRDASDAECVALALALPLASVACESSANGFAADATAFLSAGVSTAGRTVARCERLVADAAWDRAERHVSPARAAEAFHALVARARRTSEETVGEFGPQALRLLGAMPVPSTAEELIDALGPLYGDRPGGFAFVADLAERLKDYPPHEMIRLFPRLRDGWDSVGQAWRLNEYVGRAVYGSNSPDYGEDGMRLSGAGWGRMPVERRRAFLERYFEAYENEDLPFDHPPAREKKRRSGSFGHMPVLAARLYLELAAADGQGALGAAYAAIFSSDVGARIADVPRMTAGWGTFRLETLPLEEKMACLSAYAARKRRIREEESAGDEPFSPWIDLAPDTIFKMCLETIEQYNRRPEKSAASKKWPADPPPPSLSNANQFMVRSAEEAPGPRGTRKSPLSRLFQPTIRSIEDNVRLIMRIAPPGLEGELIRQCADAYGYRSARWFDADVWPGGLYSALPPLPGRCFGARPSLSGLGAGLDVDQLAGTYDDARPSILDSSEQITRYPWKFELLETYFDSRKFFDAGAEDVLGKAREVLSLIPERTDVRDHFFSKLEDRMSSKLELETAGGRVARRDGTKMRPRDRELMLAFYRFVIPRAATLARQVAWSRRADSLRERVPSHAGFDGEFAEIMSLYPSASYARDEALLRLCDSALLANPEQARRVRAELFDEKRRTDDAFEMDGQSGLDALSDALASLSVSQRKDAMLWLVGAEDRPPVFLRAVGAASKRSMRGVREAVFAAARQERRMLFQRLLLGPHGVLEPSDEEGHKAMRAFLDGIAPRLFESLKRELGRDAAGGIRRAWETAVLEHQPFRRAHIVTEMIERLAPGSASGAGERLKAVLETLGPAFVKAGQILSQEESSPGVPLLPPGIRGPLAELREGAKTFSRLAAVESLATAGAFDADLPGGARVEALGELLAAASVKQVYAATGSDRAAMVAKVLRPSAAKHLEEDMRVLRAACDTARASHRLPDRFVERVDAWMREETDFAAEAENHDMLAGVLRRYEAKLREEGAGKRSGTVRVPNLLRHGPTFILDERIDGTSLAERQRAGGSAALKDERLRVMDALLYQVFTEGIFHADPHAGNIFLARENGVAFIDFGNVGVVERERLQELRAFFYGCALRSAETVTFAAAAFFDGEVPAATAEGFTEALGRNAPLSETVKRIASLCLGAGTRLHPGFEKVLKAVGTASYLMRGIPESELAEAFARRLSAE
jgi:hypothetical protein